MFYKGGGLKFLTGMVFLSLLLFPTFVSAAAAFTSLTILATSTPSPTDEPVPHGGWVDRIPPIIIDVRVKVVEENKVQIEWDTNEDTEGYFAFGLTNNYEIQEVHSIGFVRTHKVILSDLEFDKKYFFRIIALDQAGNNDSAHNFFILIKRLPAEIPRPVPPEEPMPVPQPEPQPEPQPPVQEPQSEPVPGIPPKAPKPSVVPKQSPLFLPNEVNIITDTNPESLPPTTTQKQLPPEVPSVKKDVASHPISLFQKVQLGASHLVAAIMDHPFVLIPNKIFAVPDMVYGPYIMSVILFILSLFM